MTYPGGKAGAGVYQQIINQIPPHRIYIEPFLGAGAVWLHKKPSICSIGIDSETAVIEDWNKLGMNIPPGGIVKCDDAISFLQSYNWQGGEFVYCDPPYLFSTRSCKRPIYAHEFGTEEQHERLLKTLLAIPQNIPVAISGYQSSFYSAMLATWRTISYQTRTRGGSLVREWLWMNYPTPIELHDYRYLGSNFRQRERIKRIKNRWVARLERMDNLERYAVLASIAEYSDMIMRSASSASPNIEMVAGA